MATDDERPGQVSRFLDYLPGIYQQDTGTGRPNFLGRFLLAFEQVLTGLGDPEDPGLEEILEGIVDPTSGAQRLAGVQRYFDPGPKLPDEARAPDEFLEWLAGWMALSLRADLDIRQQRDFIASAVRLYRLRGTKQGLEEVVRIYTRLAPTIDELDTPSGGGVSLGGGAPHFFKVTIRLPSPDPEQIRRHHEVVRAIIDMEKPAHTHYELIVETPTMQIGDHSTIGVDALLGPSPD